MNRPLISTNPSENYSVIGEVSISDRQEIHEKVKAAQKARNAWKELGVKGRCELLLPICKEFINRQDELSKLITREVGKPIRFSLSEAQGYPKEFEWFLEHVETAIKDEVTFEDNASLHKIIYEPFGVAAVITPWNFPFGMAIWGIIPNLLVGNPVVFKISEECPLVGKFIEQVMLSHNLPFGVFSEIYGGGQVGKILSEEDVNLIWFTGSTKTGRGLYKTAAEKFIKVILEMGGSNPCIVFDDVDIANAAKVIYDGRFYNCGQVCDATKRLIVQEPIADAVVIELINVLKEKQIGNPMDEKTDIGSLVAKRQLELLEEQVHDAIKKGAKVIYKAPIAKHLHGAYYPPTILGNITPDMRVWKEEVFGPVLPVVTFTTEEEAITLANNTQYGLGSRVISMDIPRALRVASKIEAGTVEINDADRWLSCNPFGGYKKSGMGREHGLLGFRELCQVKVLSIAK